MNRAEFCTMIGDTTKQSRMKVADIAKAMDRTANNVYMLKAGVKNFKLQNIIKYLDIIGYKIQIKVKKNVITLSEEDDFRRWVTAVMRNEIDLNQMAKDIKISITTLKDLRTHRRKVSIDTVLLFTDYMKGKIVLNKKF